MSSDLVNVGDGVMAPYTDLPIFRTSERKAFKNCQWQWWYVYVEGLQKKGARNGALWFGQGIHLALERWYIPGKERGVDPIVTWLEYCLEASADIRVEDDDGEFLTWMDAKDLGVAMLTHMLETYGDDDEWYILSPEQTVEVLIQHPQRPGEILVRYVGVFDIVARNRKTGLIWLWDHKGLRMDEQVMTPNGWVLNGDLVVGDEVIGSDGKGTKVTGVYDLGVRELYRVHLSDKSFVDTTEDHLWTLSRAGVQSTKTRTTKEVMEGLSSPGQDRYVTLPDMDPVQWPEKDLPIHPYVLGAALGDGSFRSGCKISNPEKQIAEEVAKYTKVVEHKVGIGRCRTYALPEVWPALKTFGLHGLLSAEKFVPQKYLYASEQQRRDLLAGLLDTDGSVDPRGRTRFITTSDRLKQDVEHLVRSLGGLATSRKSPSYYMKDGVRHEAQDAWCVNIVMQESPFRLQRQRDKFKPNMKRTRNIVSIEKVESAAARCIKVEAEDSLYVTKDFIVTHNTARQIKVSHLKMDEQAGSYWSIAEPALQADGVIGENEHLRGILYNFITKSPPDERPRNADGLYCNKPVKKNYVEALAGMYDGQWAEHGDPMELPIEMTEKGLNTLKLPELVKLAKNEGLEVFGDPSKVQPAKRFHREEVQRSPKARDRQIKRIGEDYLQMAAVRDGVFAKTKNPGDHCNWCPMKMLCEIDEEGGDTEEIIEFAYEKFDPYEQYTTEGKS